MGENSVNNSENIFAYKMFNSVKYGKLLGRSFFMVMLTFAALLVVLYVIISKIKLLPVLDENKAKQVAYICLIGTVSSIVIWFIMIAKAMINLVKVYKATGYPRLVGKESFTGWVNALTLSFFKGEVKEAYVHLVWRPIILYPLASHFVSKSFKKELGIISKEVRKKAIRNMSVYIIYFEIFTILYLLINICITLALLVRIYLFV